jgi:asparagine synthase (glutamine-hydrolysing)
MLRDREGIVSSYIERGQLEQLLERHRSGVEDATDRIWRLLNLQLWGDIFLLKNRDPKEGLVRAAAGS